MKARLFLTLFVTLLICVRLTAAGTPWQPITIAPTATSAYTGPGDIVSSAVGFYGGRAYSAAVAATGTQKGYRVRRASDNTESDILILTTGYLDTAAATSFAGTDATGNATSSGTTVALTGLSGAAHAGDTITGAGFVGSYCVSVGALVAGAQTCTSNTSQSIGVSEPVTLTWGLYITKAYNQSGGSAPDLAQATAGKQPQLFVSGSYSLMRFVYTASQELDATLAGSISQPYTASSVALCTCADPARAFAAATFELLLVSGGLAKTYAGSFFSGSATAVATWYAFQAVFNGASSIIYVNSSSTTGNPGASASGTNLSVGQGYTQMFDGDVREFGIWASAFSGANNISMEANQRSATVGWNF